MKKNAVSAAGKPLPAGEFILVATDLFQSNRPVYAVVGAGGYSFEKGMARDQATRITKETGERMLAKISAALTTKEPRWIENWRLEPAGIAQGQTQVEAAA